MIGSIHARAARLAGARIRGVVSASLDSANASASRLGADRAYPTAESLIAAPDIDLVHLCVPNRHHVPLAIAAIEAGKHVICEKPLGMSGAEAREVAAVVAASDRVLTVPFVYRYYPTVREARERVASDALGQLHLMEGGYLQGWLADSGATNWRVSAAEGGQSRAFADIGSHWCDLVEFVTGHRIVELSARTHIAVPERQGLTVMTEDIALVQFATDRGAVGSVAVSQVSHGPKNRLRFRIDGADGSMAFDQEHPDSLLVGHADGSVTILPRDSDVLTPAAASYSVLPAGHPQGFHDCFDKFVAESYSWAQTGERPAHLPDVADGVRAAELVDAVLASRDGNRWVTLSGGNQQFSPATSHAATSPNHTGITGGSHDG
jgi:predicted dehydrogenase